MSKQRLGRMWIGGAIFAFLGILLAAALSQPMQAQDLTAAGNPAPGAVNAAPDLIVTGIRFLPPTPAAGVETDITPVIKNQGDATASIVKFYIYVEPEQDPPTTTTTIDDRFTFGLGLAAGATFDGYTRTKWPFTQNNPQVCVRVDPDNQVAESNEDNNLLCIKEAPKPEPTPDSFEQDDTCQTAKEIATNGTVQERNLSHEGGVNDTDWISLTVESGVLYIAKVTPQGKDAERLVLELLSDCATPGSFGSGLEVKFTAPQSGVVFLKAEHKDSSYGADHKYQLAVSRYSGCSSFAEPNNSCSVPVDFPLSLGEQSHSFCEAKDTDWVRFEVQAGGKYRVSAQNVGSKANAQLSLFGSCTGGLTEPQLTFVAPTTGYYYLEMKNGDETVFGPDTEYKVKIEELEKGCAQDRYEPDNNIASAQILGIDANKTTHNSCPKADIDWLKVEATKGTTFTVETFNLAKVADTKLCLHDSNGQKLRCDRDSGAGVGSRLILGNVEAGTYYFSVQDENDQVAGEETAYEIRALAGLCDKDSFEPDNDSGAAKTIATDNSKQAHNICGVDDADWVAFSATQGTAYVIETAKTGPEGDTLIELYDPSGAFVQRNDDFSQDVNSRIGFTAAQTGAYRVKVQHYNQTLYGTGTEYTISVRVGTATPPPTPEPKDPKPKETPPTPPATNVRTMILVHRARLADLHGDAAATQLMDKLATLAQREEVKGEIIRLDRNQQINDAYAAWTSNADNLRSVEKANLVTNAIRQLIMTYLAEHKGIEFVLLVGDDRALPLRRIPDTTTQQPEKTYTHVSNNHPTGAAILANYFLSDDFYAAKTPIPHQGRELYVPDLTTGRLVEKPADMIKLIDLFLANPKPTIQQALITGYDFVKDSAAEDCKAWRKQMGEDKVTCVIGENWSKSQLSELQLRTASPFVLQSINGHADHFRQGIPAGGGGGDLRGSTIDAVVGLEYGGGLIYTLACHAGLNVPPENTTEPLDLVEAFTHKGANYVGNTGYGWGYLYGIGLSEQVIQFFTAELKKGGSIGGALTKAKRQYYQLTRANTPFDEKVMQQITFYGLPMFQLPASLAGDPFPGVEDNFEIGGSLGPGTDLISTTASFTFTNALNNLLATSTDDSFGEHLTFGDYSTAAPDQPVQPLYFSDVSKADSELRGVVIRQATVAQDKVRTDFNATIATPGNEFITSPESQIDPLADGSKPSWYPSIEATGQSLGDQSLMVAQLGQYNPASQEQRVFGSLQVQFYYSTATDEVRPQFTVVDGLYDAKTRQVTVKIGVTDESGLQSVTVHYIEDDRQASTALKTIDARFDANLQKWVGSFPGDANSVFYVSAVDRAGNQRTANNKDLNYRPALARIINGGAAAIYLPVISR